MHIPSLLPFCVYLGSREVETYQLEPVGKRSRLRIGQRRLSLDERVSFQTCDDASMFCVLYSDLTI